MPDENSAPLATPPATSVSSASLPEPRPTIKFEAPPPWAVDLATNMRAGFVSVNSRLDNLEGSDKNIADEVSRVRRDIVDLRSDTARHEDEIRRLSIRTNGTAATASQNDLEAATQLAQERAAREALAAEHAETRATVETIKTKTESIEKKTDVQTVMLTKITGVLDTPLGKRIVQAAGGLVLAALIAASAWLARGNVQAPPPPQPIIQVVTPAALDGGVR